MPKSKTSKTKFEFRMGFIGGGNMATALIGGLLRSGLVSAKNVTVSDPSESRRSFLSSLNVKVTADNREAAQLPVVWLAVKPQVADTVMDELAPESAEDVGGWFKNPLVISIMAGISTRRLAQRLPAGSHIIRVMPNTPLLVGAGASVIARGPGASAEDAEWVLGWLRSSGKAEEIPEELMDAVTALSGSGPAYLFAVAEWMIEAGKAVGLSYEQADRLTRTTLFGASKMLAESKFDPQGLRDQVTSPGGTTEAALKVLSQKKVNEIFREAIEAAAKRSKELGKE